MVLVGSADQYLAGCWHSQENTKLCTRNDDDATDQDDGFDISGGHCSFLSPSSSLFPLLFISFVFFLLFVTHRELQLFFVNPVNDRI